MISKHFVLTPPLLLYSESMLAASNREILSVSAAADAVQTALSQHLSNTLVIQGELSNYVQHSSGHRYFSLKDSKAQLKAVMWSNIRLSFTPTNGMNVIVEGTIKMYSRQGTVQIDCRSMQPAGIGDMQFAFEALKRELYERGWLDARHKKPLPRYPKVIGVVTSPTGAAVRDILTTLERRMPAAAVIIRPTLVQGDNAPEDIAQAIREFQSTQCDVLIVGRGGGSIEDLWAFNTEIVAEAIFHSCIPIISAVGHEINRTIADLVADSSAPTPTAAAELAVQDCREIHQHLLNKQALLNSIIHKRINTAQQRFSFLAERSALTKFPHTIQQLQQQLDELHTRLHSAPARFLALHRERLERLHQHLTSLHPLAPLDRGFVLIKRDNRLLSAADTLQEGNILTLVRKCDTATVCVQHTSPTSLPAEQIGM
ncbi:MAG: exodeoxyribonuclease VII large subunit [Bacteroidota bacterium]|nr:exodeoxyribonuclease VII large subunit [Candidatus Kapabacteria bacterium]MDW8219609.1 exodeoxyribonuclease VII large subunit [Bacteroidota bacterium]